MSNNADEAITFQYTNWRGDTSTRTIIPKRVWYGKSEWHPSDQWFLHGYDLEKSEVRDFALLDIVFLKSPPDNSSL